MTKTQLDVSIADLKTVTHNALQLVINELNQGQRKKIVKNEEVKKLLDRYEVDYS